MRASILVILALFATSMAVDSCNLGTYLVSDYSVYNLAPYQKNDPTTGTWKALDKIDKNENFAVFFSICHPVVDSCDNTSKVFAKRSAGSQCFVVADDAAVNITALDANEPSQGLQLSYPSYKNTEDGNTYQFRVNISCDSNANADSKIPDFEYQRETDGSNFFITAYQSSYYGCSFANLGELVKFMQKYKAIFVVIFVVIGIFLAFFGLKLFKVAIFIMAAVGGFFLSGVLFYQFASYGSAAWVTWLLFFICLIIGLVLGYITVKFEKVGFFGVGLVLGIMGFFLLYASILKTFLDFTKVVQYVVAGACGLIGGGLALWIYKDILIIATSFCGSFLSVASVFSYIPGVPAISDLLNGTQQWSALAIVQLAAIAVITIAGIYVQYKNKKTEEDETQEGDSNQLYKNMADNPNY